MNNKYTPVIGLEVHIEQNTKSKMFCSCSANHFQAKPNSQTCPVCLGLPGALPFANGKAIENTMKLGLATGSEISQYSKFDRKHYFYPDLPKGFQTSQYDNPLCTNGKLETINSKFDAVRIKRIHLEEDTAKLVHRDGKSLVDFNRSGVPLIEMVTEPDFKDVNDVVEFLKEIQLVVRYLGISDADMEKGSMRLEANISLSKDQTQNSKHRELPDYKVELKNINSYKFLSKALNAEISRQANDLDEGRKLVQETRGYSEKTGKTFSQRIKEEAQDYRYFPEPDIAPLRITKTQITGLESQIPELPNKKRKKLSAMGLAENIIEVLVKSKKRANYFEKSVELGAKYKIDASKIASVMVNQNLDEKYPNPPGLVKKLLELGQREHSSEDKVAVAVVEVLGQNEKAVSDFKKGKEQVVGFMIGQVQRILKGEADPVMVRKALIEELKK